MRSYENWHKYQRWVYPINEYSCIACGRQAQEWTLKEEHMEIDVTRKYIEDHEAYQPMCRECHKKMDLQFMGPITRERISIAQTVDVILQKLGPRCLRHGSLRHRSRSPRVQPQEKDDC